MLCLEKQTNYVQDSQTYTTTLPHIDRMQETHSGPPEIGQQGLDKYRGRQISRSA